MKTRTETVVTIYEGWAAKDDEHPERDIILPEGVTDWFVTEYDGAESLWYVKDGKLYNEENQRIDHEGNEYKPSLLEQASPF